MTNPRMLHWATVVLASFLVWAPPAAFAQDALSRAKSYYVSADYEQALRVLETLKGKSANTEASAYQVYCLMALGRRDEARAVVESIVRTDPLYRPSETQVAPRIRTFFADIRKPLLPEVAQQAYTRAKAAFDKKDFAQAVSGFDRAIALLAEIDEPDQSAADLHTLAKGFRDLARGAVPPPDSGAAPGSALVIPPPATVGPPIYSAQYADVSAPVPLSKPQPEWRPGFFELNQTFSGELELVVSAEGRVLKASLLTSVHPRYDGPLLEAAKNWTFTPATKNGVPVNYLYVTTIRVLK